MAIPLMTTMLVSRTLIENARPFPVTLFLEPWGEDYTLEPGDVFEVRENQATEGFYLHIVYGEKMIKIWAEGQSSSCPEILLDGKLLECGHNRQLSPDDDLRSHS
jgi:hypothetical protein